MCFRKNIIPFFIALRSIIISLSYVSSDVYRLQSELHPQSGLELSIHPAETVHSYNSLLHDLLLHVIRALSKIFSSRAGSKKYKKEPIAVGGGGGSEVIFNNMGGEGR